MKLSRYNVRKNTFSRKNELTGSNVSITESLTPKRKENSKKKNTGSQTCGHMIERSSKNVQQKINLNYIKSNTEVVAW